MEDKKELECLTKKTTRVKVSSTLKGSTGNSRDKIFDGNPETSWYSDQGKIQYIYVYFDEPVNIKEIEINFDGSFGPKEIELSVSSEDEYNNKKPNLVPVKKFTLPDSNKVHKLEFNNDEVNKCSNIKTVKLLMKKFYDSFGRIIVYDLKIKGNKNL